MNEQEKEVEEGEILEAEVVESQPQKRSGILPGLALVLALVALIAAVGGSFYNYQGQESISGDSTAFKAGLEMVRRETDELRQRLNAAQESYQAQAQQLAEQKQAQAEQQQALTEQQQAQAEQQQTLAEQQQALAEQQQALAEQQQTLSAHKQSLVNQDAKLEQERVQLAQAGVEVRNAVQSLHQRIGGDNSYWMAAEAAYLIQVANHRLQLEWDLPTAINALQTADDRLRDSGDPGWIMVRELLAEEIASLKGVGLADIEGLALKLSGLAARVKELKLRGTEGVYTKPAEKAEKKPDAEQRSMKTLLRDAWEGFKSIMVIRHHGQPVSALLPPDQQLFIQQNLRLQLEAARVSLLRGNQALFDSSLKTAAALVNDYFDTDDASAESFLKELGILSKLSVRPEMPDISKSLIVLREQLNKRGENR